MSKDDEQSISKKTFEEGLQSFGKTLKTDIVDEISEVIGDALNRIDHRFNNVEDRLDRLESGQGRIERQLESHTERMDEHGLEIAKLKRRAV